MSSMSVTVASLSGSSPTDKNARSYLAIGIGVSASLLAVHVGEPVRILVVALLAGIALWSLREPTVGLLAAMPLVYMIQPTPTTLSWREYGFAAVLAVSGCAALIRAHRLLLPALRGARVPILLAVAWLAVNLATALGHGVTMSEWLRGVIPFLFLLYGVPVWFEAQTRVEFNRLWRFALGVTAALFAWHVIQVFVTKALWQPNTYIFEHGQWVLMGREEAERFGKPVYLLALRVTLILQKATSVLLPLGTIWGSWAMLFMTRLIDRRLGLALAILSTVAMVLTFTRSMLLASGLITGGLMLLAWRRGQLLRALVLAIALGTSAGATIYYYNLESIYLSRFYSMVNIPVPSRSEGQSMAEALAEALAQSPDTNITTRMEEYRMAWGIFEKSPLLGQGLGIKHKMRFETIEGESLEVRVGYVHNWIMYMLMVGGIIGLEAYAVVLFAPAFIAWRHVVDRQLAVLAIATVGAMALYALFFAVFRLIPFNLILGGLWALVLVGARTEAE